MNITDDKIDGYISDLLQSSDGILKQMEKLAGEEGFPIIGPQCGRVLMQLAYASNAQRIFEMGSGFGYSAYWFAGGMRNGGKIICTDTSDENKRRALAHFSGTKFEKM